MQADRNALLLYGLYLTSLVAGVTLQDGTGEAVTASKLEGKYVGIYFSAQWYAPIHHFFPLVEPRLLHRRIVVSDVSSSAHHSADLRVSVSDISSSTKMI